MATANSASQASPMISIQPPSRLHHSRIALEKSRPMKPMCATTTSEKIFKISGVPSPTAHHTAVPAGR